MANHQTPYIKDSEQVVLNKSFDPDFDVLAVENLVYNPATNTMDRQDPSGSTPMAVQIDDTNDPVIYIGKAPIGSATSSAVWQVVKLDTTSGLVKKWADGDASYNNIWDNRASLSYQ